VAEQETFKIPSSPTRFSTIALVVPNLYRRYCLNPFCMKEYKHLFFDLDHTLWDFDRSAQETIAELFELYGLHRFAPLKPLQFYKAFRMVNFKFWAQYNQGLITKEEIRDMRFRLVFEELGLPAQECPPKIGTEYLYNCPKKPYLLPQCLETIEALSEHFTLHILTNGFEDVQSLKLQSSGIAHFFKTVTTSECTGHKKPHPIIFGHALDKAVAQKQESLMIGDNWDTDIMGAHGFGMDSVYYNPEKKEKPLWEISEIHSLSELKKMIPK